MFDLDNAKILKEAAALQQAEGLSMQVVEESVADDDMVMIRGSSNGAAVSVLLRGANDYMLDEMDRSLHDAFCVVSASWSPARSCQVRRLLAFLH